MRGWPASPLWGLDSVHSLPAFVPLSWGSPPKRNVSDSVRMPHPDHLHEGGDWAYVGVDAYRRHCHATVMNGRER